jgi:hypothetical protein
MNDYLYEDAAAESIDFDDYGEDLGYDYPEDLDIGGEFGYGEDFEYDESMLSSIQAQQRRAQAAARARAQALARARMSVRRPTPAPPPRPAYVPPPPPRPASTTQVRQGFNRVGTDVQRIRTSLQNVDLDAKVKADLIQRALRAQSARITGTEYAMTASTIANQLVSQFPDLVSHPLLKTAVPLLPLLLLKPQRRGQGVSAFASDPRLWGPGAAFAILGLKELLDRNRDVSLSQVKAQTTNGAVASQMSAFKPGDLAELAAQLEKTSKQISQMLTPQAPQPAQAQNIVSEEVFKILLKGLETGPSSAQAAQESAKEEQASKARTAAGKSTE